MASTRLVPLDYSAKLTGARVVADRYGANINRMVVPKRKAHWRAYVNEFVRCRNLSPKTPSHHQTCASRRLACRP